MRKILVLSLLLALTLLPLNGLAGQPGPAYALSDDGKTLDFGDTAVTDFEALAQLIDSMPALETVNLFAGTAPLEQMAALTARFPKVFFGFTLRIAEHTLRTDQTAFSTLHNNKDPQHTSRDFEALKYCTKLQALDLGHNSVEDISFISGLREMRILILALNNIVDISPLKGLTKLEYIEIFRNKIRDITPLEGMDSLLDLNLCYNYVQDFSPIYGLKTLERLWLYKSSSYADSIPLSRETLNGLKAALPGCYIDSKTYSTGGGWREHPRYDTLFEIFRDSAYKPFPAVEKGWKP